MKDLRDYIDMLKVFFSRLKIFLCAPTNNMKDLLSKYAEIGNSLDRGLSIRLDNPAPNRKYLFIGNDSIISGQFIFESKDGKITIGDHSYVGGAHL